MLLRNGVFSLIDFSRRRLAVTVHHYTTPFPRLTARCPNSSLRYRPILYSSIMVILVLYVRNSICLSHIHLFIYPPSLSCPPVRLETINLPFHTWLNSTGSNFETCVQNVPSSNICFPNAVLMFCHVFSQIPEILSRNNQWPFNPQLLSVQSKQIPISVERDRSSEFDSL